MPATALDSLIFRDIFTTEAMRRVFSDEQRTAYYLEIEAALARVQGRLGIIPAEAAREIEANAGSRTSISTSSSSRPSASAIRSSAWCSRSSRSAPTGSANGATGARPPRTSPTPRR